MCFLQCCTKEQARIHLQPEGTFILEKKSIISTLAHHQLSKVINKIQLRLADFPKQEFFESNHEHGFNMLKSSIEAGALTLQCSLIG